MQFTLLLALALLSPSLARASQANLSPVAKVPIEVAVTVDDLPAHGPLPKGWTRVQIAKEFLKAFRRHKLKGVYGFVNAKLVDDVPADKKFLKLWVDAGHPLANLTYSHIDSTAVSAEEFKNDVIKNEPLLKQFRRYAGGFDYHYFRYPYLRLGDTLEKRRELWSFLVARGYRIAQPSIDFNDWAWNEPFAKCVAAAKSAEIAKLEDIYLDRAVANLKWAVASSEKVFGKRIPLVIMLHGGAFNAKLTDRLLARYKEEGVRFVSLKRALRDKSYADQGVIHANPWLSFLGQHAEIRKIDLPFPPESPPDFVGESCQ